MRYLFAFEHGGPHLLELHLRGLNAAAILDGRHAANFTFWPGRVAKLGLSVTGVAPLPYAFGALEIDIRMNHEVPEVRVAGERIPAVFPNDISATRLATWLELERVDFVPRGRALRAIFAGLLPLVLALGLTAGLRWVGQRWPEALAAVVPQPQWWPLVVSIWGVSAVAAVALGWWFGGEYLRVYPRWGLGGRFRTHHGRFGWLPTPIIASWEALAVLPKPLKSTDAATTGQPGTERLNVRLGLGDEAPILTLLADSYAGADALELIRMAHRRGIVSAPPPAKAAVAFLAARSRRVGLIVSTMVLGVLGLTISGIGSHALSTSVGQIGVAFGVLLIGLWLISLRWLLDGPRRITLKSLEAAEFG